MVPNDDPPLPKEKKRWFLSLFKTKAPELDDTSSSQVVSKSLADSILKLRRFTSETNHFNKFKVAPRDKSESKPESQVASKKIKKT